MSHRYTHGDIAEAYRGVLNKLRQLPQSDSGDKIEAAARDVVKALEKLKFVSEVFGDERTRIELTTEAVEDDEQI